MRHGAAPAATTPREARGSARGPGRRPDVRPGRQSGARPRACRHSRGSGMRRTSTAHTADGSSAPHARTPRTARESPQRLRESGARWPAGSSENLKVWDPRQARPEEGVALAPGSGGRPPFPGLTGDRWGIAAADGGRAPALGSGVRLMGCWRGHVEQGVLESPRPPQRRRGAPLLLSKGVGATGQGQG